VDRKGKDLERYVETKSDRIDDTQPLAGTAARGTSGNRA
jgi:hypothetical protein